MPLAVTPLRGGSPGNCSEERGEREGVLAWDKGEPQCSGRELLQHHKLEDCFKSLRESQGVQPDKGREGATV